MLSGLITAVVLLVVLGLALYLIEAYIPMSEPIKLVIRVIVVLFVCVYLLSLAGLVSLPMR